MLLKILFGILLLPSVCFAEEGFHSSKEGLPPAVQAAWDSTFLVAPMTKGDIGTAFVVHSERVADGKLNLFLLTANHVIQGSCGKKLGICKNIEISDGGINSGTLADIDFTHTTARAIGAEVVRRSEYPDLALLKLTVANTPLWNRKPIPLIKSCAYLAGEAVFLIGYPWAPDRTARNAKPIEDKKIVKRRWSKGIFVGDFRGPVKADGNRKYWTGNTADSLDGNSGGPALNAQGQVIGVLDAAGDTAHEKDGYPYLGDDFTQKPHSFLQHCEYLDDFVHFRPLSFVPQE